MKDWINIIMVSLGIWVYSLFGAFIINNFTFPSQSKIWDSIEYIPWSTLLTACVYFYHKVNKKDR